VVLCPIGFVCDHIEVLYDLDREAADVCREIGLEMTRAEAVNDDPRFLDMMADVVMTTIRRYERGRPLPITSAKSAPQDAIDIAILPPADVSARAIALSAALPADESQGLLLGVDRLPHITLTQQFVPFEVARPVARAARSPIARPASRCLCASQVEERAPVV
jgi:hypothetical protein